MAGPQKQKHHLVRDYEIALARVEESLDEALVNRDKITPAQRQAAQQRLNQAHAELNACHLPPDQLLHLPALILKAASRVTSTFPVAARSLCISAGSFVENGAPLTEEAGLLFADLLATMIKNAGERFGSFLEDAVSLEALEHMSPPAAHFLTFPKARLSLQEDPEVMAAMDCLRFTSPGRKMLSMMVNAPHDEPLVVLHLEEKKGFVVRISGVAENAQLMVLLMDCLCGLPEAQRLQGTRPSRETVEVYTKAEAPQGISESLNWTWAPCLWTGSFLNLLSLVSEGDPNPHIDGQGIPFDIIKFRGQRVLLLTSTLKVAKSFSTLRIFKPLDASVEVEKVLSPGEVERWFEDFQASTPEEREAAIAEGLLRNQFSAKPKLPIPGKRILSMTVSARGSDEKFIVNCS